MFKLNIMHCDISYRNILLGQFKELADKAYKFLGIVIDFGFAVNLNKGNCEPLACLTVCAHILFAFDQSSQKPGNVAIYAT